MYFLVQANNQYSMEPTYIFYWLETLVAIGTRLLIIGDKFSETYSGTLSLEFADWLKPYCNHWLVYRSVTACNAMRLSIIETAHEGALMSSRPEYSRRGITIDKGITAADYWLVENMLHYVLVALVTMQSVSTRLTVKIARSILVSILVIGHYIYWYNKLTN